VILRKTGRDRTLRHSYPPVAANSHYSVTPVVQPPGQHSACFGDESNQQVASRSFYPVYPFDPLRSQLLVSKVTTRLPQELLDKIIGHLPQNDRRSLRNCSLVAKSWIHTARKRLFEEVDLTTETSLESWLNKISLENLGLLQHYSQRTRQSYQLLPQSRSPRPSQYLSRGGRPAGPSAFTTSTRTNCL